MSSQPDDGIVQVDTKHSVRVIIGSFSPFSAMLAWLLAMASSLCLSVCLSVTSRCFIKTAEQINLFFNMGASFHLSYTVLQGNLGTSENKILPSGTWSQTLDSEIFATAYRSCCQQNSSMVKFHSKKLSGF